MVQWWWLMVKAHVKMLLPRLLKGLAKALIAVIAFLVLAQFLTPLNTFFPQAYALIETYVIVYVVFIILGDLTKGMIYEHMLGMGKAFFFMGYTVYALNRGVITQSIESVSFTVNIEVFLMMMILIGTLEFAKSMLQLINFMATKAETEEIFVVFPEEVVVAE